MALDVQWPTPTTPTGLITIPKADTALVSIGPPEIRSFDINQFRLDLGDLWASAEGGPYSRPFSHQRESTVAGFTYARQVRIEAPYRVEFEDGQYVVQLFGANNNVLDVISSNQVSVQVQNSGGLLNNNVGIVAAVWNAQAKDYTALGTMGLVQLLKSYDDGNGNLAIFYRSTAANTNTVLGVDGTLDNPVSTAAAARTLAEALGIYRIHVGDVMTLTQSWDFTAQAWVFVGNGWEGGSGVTVDGFSTSFAKFESLNLRGPMNTGSGALITAVDCYVTAFTAIELSGTLRDCVVAGTVNVGTGFGGSYTRFVNCRVWGGEPSGMVLDLAIGNCKLDVVNASGKWSLRNSTVATNTATVASSEGAQVTLAASNTSGTVYIAGTVELLDSSAGMAVDVSRMTTTLVADAVSEEPVVDHVTAGTRGFTDLLALYKGKVWINGQTGSAGTVLGTNGTEENPVTTWADAVVLLIATRLRTIDMKSTFITLDRDLDGYHIEGPGALSANGFSLNQTVLRNISLTGVVKTNTFPIWEGECFLWDVTLSGGPFRGFCVGTMNLAPTKETTWVDCYSVDYSESFIGARGVSCEFKAATSSQGNAHQWVRWHGPITFDGFTLAGVDLDLHIVEGVVTINATCTEGTLTITGNPTDVVDNSGPNFTVTVVDDLHHEEMALVRKMHTNRLDAAAGNPGTLTLYDDDGVTPIKTWNLTDHNDGAVTGVDGAPAKRGAAT